MTTRPSSPIADAAPSEARLTDYDREHLTTYLRLLDAAEEDAPWDEVARLVLGIDASRQPDRASRAHESHLARARWLTDHGYRDLLGTARARPENEGLS
ncbi:MAG: DNA -binding domain-containing protein [Caulobacteraceae bacterium]